jgi:SHAQKYF class myb-like DNA-binding protein
MSDQAPPRKRPRPPEANEGREASVSEPSSDLSSREWPEELHRCFVSAIFDCGLLNVSPSLVLAHMTNPPASVSSERVKSHLQKYRKKKEISKAAFMADYDAFMRTAKSVSGADGNANNMLIPPAMLMNMMDGLPSGGDVAAFLTLATMAEGNTDANCQIDEQLPPIGSLAKDAPDYSKDYACARVPYPKLSEEEKRSPLGISVAYVMGLLSVMVQHMVQERRKHFKTNPPTKPAALPSQRPESGDLSDSHPDKPQQKRARDEPCSYPDELRKKHSVDTVSDPRVMQYSQHERQVPLDGNTAMQELPLQSNLLQSSGHSPLVNHHSQETISCDFLLRSLSERQVSPLFFEGGREQQGDQSLPHAQRRNDPVFYNPTDDRAGSAQGNDLGASIRQATLGSPFSPARLKSEEFAGAQKPPTDADMAAFLGNPVAKQTFHRSGGPSSISGADDGPSGDTTFGYHFYPVTHHEEEADGSSSSSAL